MRHFFLSLPKDDQNFLPPEANRKQDRKRFLTNTLIINTKLRKKNCTGKPEEKKEIVQQVSTPAILKFSYSENSDLSAAGRFRSIGKHFSKHILKSEKSYTS